MEVLQRRSCLDEGRLQVTAAVRLLQHSRLLRWHQTKDDFAAVRWQEFDDYWRKSDPIFGRLICWMTFSAGAELLIKGVCLANCVDIRGGPRPDGIVSFGTLGNLWDEQKKKKGQKTHLDCLFEKVGAEPGQKDGVLVAYQSLTTTIRNRDAHAYVPNVRNNDFDLVSERFVPCFNLLMSWLPEGLRTMSDDELAELC
jgi:hypothetical protein